MTDPTHDRHADDAHADDAPPTDAVTDEVREAASTAEDHAGAGGTAEQDASDGE